MNKLTVIDILISSGRYPERQKNRECTEEVRKNAQILCDRVNTFLSELGWTKKLDITSGFRTSGANSSTSNAGSKSRHLIGAACDILDDKDQTLAKLIQSREDLLIKHDLYTEHLNKTMGKTLGWVHLEWPGPKSKKRIFYP